MKKDIRTSGYIERVENIPKTLEWEDSTPGVVAELLYALKTARAQVVTLGGNPRKHPDNEHDEIQFFVVEVIDAAIAKATAAESTPKNSP